MKIYKPSYAHKGGIVWSKPSKISKPWDKSSLRKEKKPAAQGKKIQALGTNRNGDGKRNARVGLLRMLMLKDAWMGLLRMLMLKGGKSKCNALRFPLSALYCRQ
jgi:hypothetical protein